MSKVHYLNSHLEKFREEKRITIDVENIGDLAQYGNMGGEDKKTTKIFTKCFKNKEQNSPRMTVNTASSPSEKLFGRWWKTCRQSDDNCQITSIVTSVSELYGPLALQTF